MFNTTLRLPDALGAFLQEAAQEEAMSVNAWLTRLLEREHGEARKRRLARDWAAYAAEDHDLEEEYPQVALEDRVAEPSVEAYGAPPPPTKAPKPGKRGGRL